MVGALTTGAPHEIHTTHTTVRADATGYTLTIRAFADDLSASVAHFRNKPTPADSSVPTPDLVDYTAARMQATNETGDSLAMHACGVQRKQDVYLICIRIPAVVSNGTLRIGNQMLAELHSDQVNIVQCEAGETRRTHLFTRGRAPSTMVTRGRCATT